MPAQIPIPDKFTLSGDHLSRVGELLRLTRRFARIAGDGYGPHVQDALAELQDEITDRIAAIENAEQDDKATVEALGEAEHERQPYLSSYRAA